MNISPVLACCLAVAGCKSMPYVDPAKYCVKQVDGGCVLREQEYLHDLQIRNSVVVWRCTAFDWGTTAVGLGVGLAEGGLPLVFKIPATIIQNHEAKKDTPVSEMTANFHCGAGVLNIVTITSKVVK